VVNVFPLAAQVTTFFIGAGVRPTYEVCAFAKVPLPILGN
jgi:hypothetical protein